MLYLVQLQSTAIAENECFGIMAVEWGEIHNTIS